MDVMNQEWRDSLKNNLTKGEASIIFNKINGQKREMRCTLQKNVVPSYSEKGARKKSPNGEVLAVWDLEQSEWRSFRYDGIISVCYFYD